MYKEVETNKKCLRCGYEWRSKIKNPIQCANCRNPKWNVPRQIHPIYSTPPEQPEEKIMENKKSETKLKLHRPEF